MSRFTTRRRLAFAALIAAATIGPAASATADPDAAQARCDVRLERLEAKFHDVAERRGYEAATEWWEARWSAYFQRCVV